MPFYTFELIGFNTDGFMHLNFKIIIGSKITQRTKHDSQGSDALLPIHYICQRIFATLNNYDTSYKIGECILN